MNFFKKFGKFIRHLSKTPQQSVKTNSTSFSTKIRNLWKKGVGFISRSTHSKIMGLIIMIVLTFAVILTVTIAQQQQTIKQHAAGPGESCTVGWECDHTECQTGECLDWPNGHCVITNLPYGTSCSWGNGTCSNGWCDLRPTPTSQPSGYNCGGSAWSNPDWDCFSYADDCNLGLCRGYSGNESSCQKVPSNSGGSCNGGSGTCNSNGGCNLRPTSTSTPTPTPTTQPPATGYNCGGLAWSNPDLDCISYADPCNDGLCRGNSGNQSSCRKVPKGPTTPCVSGTFLSHCDGNGTCVGNSPNSLLPTPTLTSSPQCIIGNTCPSDGNPCHEPTCSAGKCTQIFKSLGTICTNGSINGKCNYLGECVSNPNTNLASVPNSGNSETPAPTIKTFQTGAEPLPPATEQTPTPVSFSSGACGWFGLCVGNGNGCTTASCVKDECIQTPTNEGGSCSNLFQNNSGYTCQSGICASSKQSGTASITPSTAKSTGECTFGFLSCIETNPCISAGCDSSNQCVRDSAPKEGTSCGSGYTCQSGICASSKQSGTASTQGYVAAGFIPSGIVPDPVQMLFQWIKNQTSGNPAEKTNTEPLPPGTQTTSALPPPAPFSSGACGLFGTCAGDGSGCTTASCVNKECIQTPTNEGGSCKPFLQPWLNGYTCQSGSCAPNTPVANINIVKTSGSCGPLCIGDLSGCSNARCDQATNQCMQYPTNDGSSCKPFLQPWLNGYICQNGACSPDVNPPTNSLANKIINPEDIVHMAAPNSTGGTVPLSTQTSTAFSSGACGGFFWWCTGDGSGCTTNDYCDTTTNKCMHTPAREGQTCNDNPSYACQSGTCAPKTSQSNPTSASTPTGDCCPYNYGTSIFDCPFSADTKTECCKWQGFFNYGYASKIACTDPTTKPPQATGDCCPYGYGTGIFDCPFGADTKTQCCKSQGAFNYGYTSKIACTDPATKPPVTGDCCPSGYGTSIWDCPFGADTKIQCCKNNGLFNYNLAYKISCSGTTTTTAAAANTCEGVKGTCQTTVDCMPKGKTSDQSAKYPCPTIAPGYGLQKCCVPWCYNDGAGGCTDRTGKVFALACSDDKNALIFYDCSNETGECVKKSTPCKDGKCSTENGSTTCRGGSANPTAPPEKPNTVNPPCINPTAAPYTPPYTTPAPGSPTPTSNLATVTLVSALNAQDVSLTADTITTAITLYDLSTNTEVASAPAAQVYNSTKIPGRQYSATITIANLFLNEKYFVVIRYNNMIAKTVFAVTNSTRTITAPTTTLVFGDVNSDDDINIIDYNLLRSCWKNPATGSCTASDFDQSGGSVDEVDYNTWLRGFATWSSEVQEL